MALLLKMFCRIAFGEIYQFMQYVCKYLRDFELWGISCTTYIYRKIWIVAIQLWLSCKLQVSLKRYELRLNHLSRKQPRSTCVYYQGTNLKRKCFSLDLLRCFERLRLISIIHHFKSSICRFDFGQHRDHESSYLFANIHDDLHFNLLGNAN